MLLLLAYFIYLMLVLFVQKLYHTIHLTQPILKNVYIRLMWHFYYVIQLLEKRVPSLNVSTFLGSKRKSRGKMREILRSIYFYSHKLVYGQEIPHPMVFRTTYQSRQEIYSFMFIGKMIQFLTYSQIHKNIYYNNRMFKK